MTARISLSLVVALGLGSFATQAASPAAQWQVVATQTGSRVELDKNRIARLKGGQTSAWTRLSLDTPLLDFENKFRYSTVEALNHYDCAKGSFATQQRIYLLDGQEKRSEKVKGPLIPVQPDSLDARVLDEVCKPRSVAEMRATAAKLAAVAAQAEEAKPRAMHAEMVTDGEASPPRTVKVADASPTPSALPPVAGEKPRFFDKPAIDTSKAEDPFKNKAAPPVTPAATPPVTPPATPPAPSAKEAAKQIFSQAAKPTPQPAPQPAPRATAAPVARAEAKQVPTSTIPQDLSRQQRELMLATSGPRKLVAKKDAGETKPQELDYSHVHWGYSGAGAPEHWGKLPGSALCGFGKRQSPIDIRGGIKVDLEPIRFEYGITQFRIADTGRTVQADVGDGFRITIMGRTYALAHIHFHRPSEERVNGKTYEMSAHLVHRDIDNNLAVIAVMMERGAEHPTIQTLWNHMPLEVGIELEPPNVTIDLNKLLPAKRDYYTYMGSLTTPPCTENVLWMVFKEPIPVSPEQIAIFARLYPNNARPVQPAHDRLIKESR